jgi:hypothetical protein
MASTHTTPTIEETADGLRITMPVPRMGCVSVFLGVWLVAWVVGEVSAVGALFSLGAPLGPGSAFLMIWLAGWTAGGVTAAAGLMMSLGGREIVTVGGGVIRRRAEAFGLGLSWRYQLERCSNFRPTGGSSDEKTFISFDYAEAKGEHSVRFGSGLTEASTEEIAERVWTAFPELMPDHERRIREHQAAEAQPLEQL